MGANNQLIGSYNGLKGNNNIVNQGNFNNIFGSNNGIQNGNFNILNGQSNFIIGSQNIGDGNENNFVGN